jgi:hypothetical protein
MSAQTQKLHAVDELIYVRLLTAIECHPRALELLVAPPHTILMKIGTETYFVLYTLKSDFLILLVDDPQSYDVTWEDDITLGLQAVENALDFFRDLLRNHPEELVEEHLDFVMSLSLIHEAFVAPVEQILSEGENQIENKLLRSTAASILEDERLTANILPKKRRKPLFGSRKEYLH